MEPTREHKVIKAWAESRRAIPAMIVGTEDGIPATLRFIIPGANHLNRDLVPISWEEFFAYFDLFDLSFAFQSYTAAGDTSSLNEILSVQIQRNDPRNWH